MWLLIVRGSPSQSVDSWLHRTRRHRQLTPLRLHYHTLCGIHQTCRGSNESPLSPVSLSILTPRSGPIPPAMAAFPGPAAVPRQLRRLRHRLRRRSSPFNHAEDSSRTGQGGGAPSSSPTKAHPSSPPVAGRGSTSLHRPWRRI
jgi:hypothetical protein